MLNLLRIEAEPATKYDLLLLHPAPKAGFTYTGVRKARRSRVAAISYQLTASLKLSGVTGDAFCRFLHSVRQKVGLEKRRWRNCLQPRLHATD